MEEEVVLFPLRSHDPEVKVLRVARVSGGKLDNQMVHHIAGGPYKGIIVSKGTQEYPSKDRPHVVREFLAHVHDVKKARILRKDTKENRKVFMWFKDGNFDREQVADKFFKMLIDPDNFPKDYISFVKKVIVLTKAFHAIRNIELELSPAVEYLGCPPLSPGYRLSWIAKPENFSVEEEIKKQENSPVCSKPRPDPPPRRASRTQTVSTVHEVDEEPNDRLSNKGQENTPESPNKPREQSPVEEVVTKQTVITSSRSKPTGQPEEATPVDREQDRGQDDDNRTDNVTTTSSRTDDDGRVVEVTVTRRTVTHTEKTPVVVVTEEDNVVVARHRLLVLTVLEDAFPNALDSQQIASGCELSQDETNRVIDECSGQGLIQKLDGQRWIRISTVRRKSRTDSRLSSRISTSASKHDFQVVPQMPVLPDNEQPHIAIITLLYCEKQAVDAMMDSKTTYVRYKTEGEGQVYTVGKIASHRVVSTKLIRVGTGQGETMSAGNLVTRLLGTFSKIQHVFLVGVGGSIPDYNNDKNHVRCGDVIISLPQFAGNPSYVSVTDVDGTMAEGNVSFGTQSWEPKNEELMRIISGLSKSYSPRSMVNTSVNQYIRSGLGELMGQELSFDRPAATEDRLYKLTDDGAWTEVEHPEPAADSPRRAYSDRPVIYFGSVGTGYDKLVQDGSDLRQEFALFNEIKALDVGFQAVMESMQGNCTESFWLVRGVADYKDGMSGTEWQPYASLAAAAATKSLLSKLSTIRM